MFEEKGMRRTPQQVRGRHRVFKILEAAAEVFVETGYEAATTNAIALRANTSIGSLYQFFPNKSAILAALAQRYKVQLQAAVAERHDADKTSAARLCALIESVVNFYNANPAFQTLFGAARTTPEMSAAADEVCSPLVDHLTALLAAATPPLSREFCAPYALVVVYMMRALIPVSEGLDQKYGASTLLELNRMICLYLNSVEAFRSFEFTAA